MMPARGGLNKDMASANGKCGQLAEVGPINGKDCEMGCRMLGMV